MYNIKINDELCINSRELLNSDIQAMEKLFIQDNVDPKSVDDMMRTIFDWYQKEPHLPVGQLHEQFVARLLVMRKYSIEKIKQKIDHFYSARPKVGDFLCNRDPVDPNLNKCLKTGYWVVLPRRTPENFRVTIFRIKSSESVSVLDLVKVIFMISEYRMWNDSVRGEHIIIDCSNVSLQLILQLTPVTISKVIYYLTECLGPNIKGLHFVNLPTYAETAVLLLKKTLKPKVVKRMHMYKSFDEVLKTFPKNIFPKDLGGTDDVTCQNITDAWEETLCSDSWRNYFLKQDSIYSDDTRRTIKNNFHDDFGLDGSFKKLNID